MAADKTFIHTAPPSVPEIVARLRELFGPETTDDGETYQWWVPGTRPNTGVSLTLARRAEPLSHAGEPNVVWASRPGESRPERCPISTLAHLDSFLALLSIARRTPTPLHGQVCPEGS